MIRCGLCGFEFDENETGRACASCLMARGCKLIRCPRCGFEAPPEPKWAKYIKRKEVQSD